MLSNLELYKKDLDALIRKGDLLQNAMQAECYPKEFKEKVTQQLREQGLHDKALKTKLDERLRQLPTFDHDYQSWYSEAGALIRQLLPDRLSDFVGYYEKPKNRKTISYENYKVADYLQGLTITSTDMLEKKLVGPDGAIPQFQQQLAILKSAKRRFESSLFDIRQLVQADLFDSELEAAEELAKNKFTRAAGALAGVVLERHLIQVCDNHKVVVSKKTPTISDLNNLLKDANVLDTPTWRSIQHLTDLRNLCDHQKASEPTGEQVTDLIAGVKKISKTLF